MTKKGMPKVSVIMPVYNPGIYLKQAIDSILDQTYDDLELIAINDGSSDNSLKILEHYAEIDKRVRVFDQANQGLVATLNRGLSLVQGKYVARMDPDDISFPRRFEQEVAILDKNPKVVLVTGGFEVIDKDDEFLYREVLPTNSEDIKRAMFLRNPIAHGSVMIRKEALDKAGEYSSTCGPIEDFYLWTQLAEFGDFIAVEAAVYKWRVSGNGITSTKSQSVMAATKRHINTLWQDTWPEVLGTRELRQRGWRYFKEYKKRGVDMKNIVWADTARIAVKMIRRGRVFAGCYQLLTLAFTGRAGTRAVLLRFRLIAKGSMEAARRRAVGTRQETAAERIHHGELDA